MASIYGLYDTQGRLRYIDKANDPAKRLKSHMSASRSARTPLYDWIRKHGCPEMRVLVRDCEDWQETERMMIAEARLRGEAVLNLADGGDEPFCSREQRQKNARRTVAKGHGFTSERAREYALALNVKLQADPDARRIRELKRSIAAYVKEHGFTPERLGKLFYASRRAPHVFGPWFERITSKYLQPFTDEECVRFIKTVDELCG